MEIHTKYDIGQYVFALTFFNRTTTRVPCKTCKGSAHVIIEGESFRCPKCHGQGGENVYEHIPSAQIQTRGTIGQIEVVLRTDGRRSQETRYMLDTTGIGSGTIWPEESLAATREEAEAIIAAYGKEKTNGLL